MRLALAVCLLWCSPAFAAGTLARVNVLDYGVTGNGVTDDRAAIQNVLDNVVAERGTVYFPARHYFIGGTIDCGGRAFNFRGDGKTRPFSSHIGGGSFIRGDFAGPLIRAVYPAEGLSIEDMGFANRHSAGVGLGLEGTSIAVNRVSVYAYRAIWLGAQTFTATLQDVTVRWKYSIDGQQPGSVGLIVPGHTLVHGADVVNFAVGIRLRGPGNDLRSMRVEVNGTGIELGVTEEGANWALTGSSVESVSMEANVYGVVARSVTSCGLRNVMILGSANAPGGQSRSGLVVHHSQWTAYEQVIASGSYTEGAIRVTSSQPTTVPVRFQLCKANNTLPGGIQWDLARPPDANLVLEQCS